MSFKNKLNQSLPAFKGIESSFPIYRNENRIFHEPKILQTKRIKYKSTEHRSFLSDNTKSKSNRSFTIGSGSKKISLKKLKSSSCQKVFSQSINEGYKFGSPKKFVPIKFDQTMNVSIS